MSDAQLREVITGVARAVDDMMASLRSDELERRRSREEREREDEFASLRQRVANLSRTAQTDEIVSNASARETDELELAIRDHRARRGPHSFERKFELESLLDQISDARAARAHRTYGLVNRRRWVVGVQQRGGYLTQTLVEIL